MKTEDRSGLLRSGGGVRERKTNWCVIEWLNLRQGYSIDGEGKRPSILQRQLYRHRFVFNVRFV